LIQTRAAMSAPTKSISILGLCLGVFLAGCGSPEGGDTSTPDADVTDQGDQVVKVGGRMFSVPSPIQSALTIRDAGLGYQREAMLRLEAGAEITGRTAQALALGMYGADLAYATANQDGQRTLATLQAIEKLGAKLDLSNAFDRALLDRFRDNLSNEDSLLRFSGSAFRAADEYLKTNERDDVSALVLAGGWIEALHLSLSDPKAGASKTIVARVGEQRNTLDGLVELLSAYSSDAGVAALVSGLQDLQVEFNGIDYRYTYAEPVTDREARTTYINSSTAVTISPERLMAIATKVASLRTSMLA
jgi:hypothetical protein